MCEWVQKEQQELQEVEKTLERAAEILQVSLQSIIKVICSISQNQNVPMSNVKTKYRH